MEKKIRQLGPTDAEWKAWRDEYESLQPPAVKWLRAVKFSKPVTS